MTPQDDDLLFIEEDEVGTETSTPALAGPTWEVLVVDDDAGIHDVTRMVLRGFVFEGLPIQLFHAHSAAEAKTLMAEHPDAAMMLLDVVMETEQAGLEVVHFVRRELRNHLVRIVLRTGQPGSAPEESVIADYDINDYKEKTELTARKLTTLMFSCLRAYRDLRRLEENKRGLEQIIRSSSDLNRHVSLDRLSSGILEQLDALLSLRGTLLADSSSGSIAAIQSDSRELNIIAGTGSFGAAIGKSIDAVLPDDARQHLAVWLTSPDTRLVQTWDDKCLGLFRSARGESRVVFLTGFKPQSEFDTYLINLYLGTVGESIDNLRFRDEIDEAQRELVYRLGDTVEKHVPSSGMHLKCVAEMGYRLALLAGMSERDALILKSASPVHDLGLIGIPEAILHKPDKLDATEWDQVYRHPLIGHNLLRDSSQEIVAMSAVIALEHHERWDGTGYPSGKRGDEIHLAARIVALVDVFNTLCDPSPYREAWLLDRIIAELRDQSGRQFDPTLISLFLDHLDLFEKIRRQCHKEGPADTAAA